MAWPCAGASRPDARSPLLRVSRGRPDADGNGACDVTTDQMTGALSANVDVRDGPLVVTGETAPGLPSPWAGVIWMPGEQSLQSRGLLRPGGDPLPDGRSWTAVLGDADWQLAAGRAASHRDVRGARGMNPSGDLGRRASRTATPEVIAGLGFVAEGR